MYISVELECTQCHTIQLAWSFQCEVLSSCILHSSLSDLFKFSLVFIVFSTIGWVVFVGGFGHITDT